MKQQHAFSATVTIGEDEYTIPTNGVTIEVSPVFQGEFLGYLATVRGLPTEDPDVYHDLNKEIGQSEDDRCYLTKDAQVDIEGDDVVVTGMTQYSGLGDKVKTRLPEEAVEWEWDDNAESQWVKNKHIWEGNFHGLPTDQEPTFDLLFGWEDPDTLGDVLAEFADAHPDAEIHGDDQQLFIEDVGWAAQEAGSVCFGHDGGVTTVIRDADPDDFEIMTGEYSSPIGWDNYYALPGAHEMHGDGPWLIYEDDNTNVLLG